MYQARCWPGGIVFVWYTQVPCMMYAAQHNRGTGESPNEYIFAVFMLYARMAESGLQSIARNSGPWFGEDEPK